MDSPTFDVLTRRLVSATSRRAVVASIVAGAAAVQASQTDAKRKKRCVKAGTTCSKRKKCCAGSGTCVDKVCACAGGQVVCNGTCIAADDCCNDGDVCGQWSERICQSGTCVNAACTHDTDCHASGLDSFCGAVVCLGRACVVTTALRNEPLPENRQVVGDCQQLVCDGEGGTKQVVDDNDADPLDTNPCLTYTCVNGVPSSGARPVGFPCPDGTCDGNGNCAIPI